ncbi:RNase H domain-containing protein [Caerostris darwini]|uniref:RNase H domain-containing protein n=1 Tax=Caerostris darwini TaxID=1538125 RepID=A0AAV4RM52_9ARAC|nr:RNase H domain-containing protein [Caerostris darwini]
MVVNLVVSRGLSDATIITDSRSALLALENPLNTTPSVSEVKGILQEYIHSIKFMWTRAQVGTAGNEAADAYAKLSTEKDSIDCHLALSKSHIKHLLLQDTLQQWQSCWNTSLKGRAGFELCPVVNLKRLHGNFYINQLITDHGALAKYQGKFFHKDEVCPCGKAVEDRLHLVFHCERWQDFRDKCFPKNFRHLSLLQLLLCKTVRTALEAIMKKKLEVLLQELLP